MSTRKPRLYFASATMLATEWRERAGFPRHVVQGGLAIIATTKAAAVDLLIAGGQDRYAAECLVADTRMRKHDPSDWPTHDRLLAEGGVIDPDIPIAVAYHAGRRGDLVVRVDDPALPIIGRFRLDSHRLYAEAVDR